MHWAIVSCEHQRAFSFMTSMAGEDAVAGFAVNLLVEVNQHTVVMHRNTWRSDQFITVILGCGECRKFAIRPVCSRRSRAAEFARKRRLPGHRVPI